MSSFLVVACELYSFCGSRGFLLFLRPPYKWHMWHKWAVYLLWLVNHPVPVAHGICALPTARECAVWLFWHANVPVSVAHEFFLLVLRPPYKWPIWRKWAVYLLRLVNHPVPVAHGIFYTPYSTLMSSFLVVACECYSFCGPRGFLLCLRPPYKWHIWHKCAVYLLWLVNHPVPVAH
jgi:hypothetical protein